MVEVVNGAGPAHGKSTSVGVYGRKAGCVVGGGKHGCYSGLSDTMQHSELPEHPYSGQLDGLLGERLVVCQCGHGGSC